jgi:2-polyprenyl-3-methyl-5-hydroxy-6-metoxy-1,4-benzoquinol methylase
VSQPLPPAREQMSGRVADYQYDDLLVRSDDQYAMTKYRMVLAHLAKAPSLEILNAGCGSGELSFLLAQAGHRVLGIVSSDRYIELARRGAGAAGVPGCSFEVSSIESFTARQQFDCVVACDVLEHVADDRAAFARLVSLTKPSGLIIVTVPAGPWLFGFHDQALGHFRRYSLRGLRSLAGEHCGIEAARYFGFSLIPICYLYSKLLRRAYPVAETGRASSPWMGRVLNAVLQLDRRLPMPFGTSLLLKARVGGHLP